MNTAQKFKKIFSAILVLVLLVSMVPTTAFAASGNVVDSLVIFTDLHSSKSDYKASTLKAVMTAVKNAGLNVSSVTSGGDAFSVNGSSTSYTGYTSTHTASIQSVLGNIPVNYVWSDHDREALEADDSTLLNKTSRLVYGAGSDGIYGTSDDANYYVYALSMGDLCSYDRYTAGFNYTASDNSGRIAAGFTPTVDQAIANFRSDAAKLKKDRPLFISSHQPLFDNRNDNAFAEQWFDAINAVAAEMDVAFFYGHNHNYDSGSDYYYAKGSTMPVATADNWNYNYEVGQGYKPSINLNSENKTLNFTHMCAGYLAPGSTGSTSSTTRQGTVLGITIYENAIQYTTYNANGIYTGNYAQNVTVPREFASSTPSHTHSYTAAITSPTCTAEGYTTYTCSCGDSYTEDYTVALGHNHVLTDTTADAEGNTVYTYTCTGCGDSYTEVVEAEHEHTYETVTVAATCIKAGSVTTTCTGCGDSTTEVLPATGHNYGTVTVDATCTKDGYTTYTCKVCGVYYHSDHVEALGHDYDSTVTSATCTTMGFTNNVCTVCGYSCVTDTVPAMGHNYISQEYDGYVVFNCTTCGDSYIEAVNTYSYKKASKFTAGDQFVIVLYSNNQYYALSHSGGKISLASVTVSNNEVTSTVTEDLLWKYSSKKLYYKDDNNKSQYLAASGTTLSIKSSGAASINYSGSKLKVGTKYLRFANNAVSLSTNSTATYLYKQGQ